MPDFQLEDFEDPATSESNQGRNTDSQDKRLGEKDAGLMALLVPTLFVTGLVIWEV